MIDRKGIISGRVKNYGDAPWRGFISAHLITDGRDDTPPAREFVTIEPGQSYAYSLSVSVFHPARERYDARVSWEEQ